MLSMFVRMESVQQGRIYSQLCSCYDDSTYHVIVPASTCSCSHARAEVACPARAPCRQRRGQERWRSRQRVDGTSVWHNGVRVLDHSMFDLCVLSFWLIFAWVLSLALSWKVTHGKIVNITRYMNVKVAASLPVSCVFRQPPHACNLLLHLYLGTCRHRFLVD